MGEKLFPRNLEKKLFQIKTDLTVGKTNNGSLLIYHAIIVGNDDVNRREHDALRLVRFLRQFQSIYVDDHMHLLISN